MRDDVEGMPPEEPVEWYLARDGHQYGPLTDVEMAKSRELGHLETSDLVWRKGFANWRPAWEVFDK
jgi:GYF domain 2